MKVKVKKTDRELIADYSNIRDIHAFRYGVLDFIIGSKENVIILIDTNLCIKKLPIDDITTFLKTKNLEHITVPTEKVERKLFGISEFFGKKKKPQITENILMIMITKEQFKKYIYDDFLKYYDYGIMAGIKEPLEDILDLYRVDHSEVMFNKEVSDACYYDSVIFTRMRTNSDDRKLENHIGLLGT